MKMNYFNSEFKKNKLIPFEKFQNETQENMLILRR